MRGMRTVQLIKHAALIATLGLGTAAKLYPLFLLGALLVVALRRGRLPDFGRAVLGAGLAWTAVNVPVMLYGFNGWKGFWSFNADRGPDLGSLWLVASRAGHHASAETVNTVSWNGSAFGRVG